MITDYKPTIVLVLNSPSGSGKDEVAKYLHARYGYSCIDLKSRAIEITKAVFGVSDIEWDQMYTRENKDTPHWKLRPNKGEDWLTPRQALIFICEEVVKPNMGSSYFGECAVKELVKGEVNVITDAGFSSEVSPFVEEVGWINVHKIVINREGCEFNENDSRMDIDDILFNKVLYINNNSTLSHLYSEVDRALASLNS